MRRLFAIFLISIIALQSVAASVMLPKMGNSAP